jgi:hypothetical protein
VSGRFSDPFIQYLDSTPNVRSSARLFFYENGTSTKLDTYPTLADRIAGTNANTNPIVLNSTGHPSVGIFLKNQGYTVVLAPSGSDDPPTSPIWTADDVYGTDLSTVTETKVGSGSPTGVVAGTAGSSGVLPTLYWDYTNEILYVASVTGTAATTEWTALNASAATPSVPPPQGYLTLVTGTPVITSDQAAKTAVFYTPDKGNLIPIYNGSNFTPTEFSELTLTLVASHVASAIYDIFVWSESGVVTIGTGPAWSTATAGSGARGTGASTTELTRIKGLLVNANSMTARNSSTTYTVGANLGTYVGSIFMDGTNGQVTCHRSFGQTRKWGLWNAYNRRRLYLKAGDSTASWAYNTATIRASNNDSDNSLTVFSGLAEEYYDLRFKQRIESESASVARLNNGIGWNSTTSMSGFLGVIGSNAGGSSVSVTGNGVASYLQTPALGINVVTALENAADPSGTDTDWFGSENHMLLTARWMG